MSYALRPVWLARAFLFAIPIIGVALGRAAVVSKFPRLVMLALVVIIVLQVGIVFRVEAVAKHPNYAYLSASLRPLVHEGDCIVILEHPEIFWGMSRYFVGPVWGDGLRVSTPPSANWARILTKLPAPVAAYLARKDRFVFNNITIVAGHPDDLASACKQIFYAAYELPPVGVIPHKVYIIDEMPAGW
jgi:hypothetical protein